MRAYRINNYGDFNGIVLHNATIPEPKSNEAVVHIKARSLNYRDLLILRGQYPLPGVAGVVPLSDGAGQVVAIGSNVTQVRVGDRVTATYFPRWRSGLIEPDQAIEQFGCTRDGMLADFVCADEQALVRLPSHLSYEEGASLPCAGVTAWSALEGGGRLQPGQFVLIIGTGGVALFAVQFAKLFGARILSITSSEEKADLLKRLGAEVAIVRGTNPNWNMTVKEMTEGRGVDRVVETGGIDTLPISLSCCAYNADVALVHAQMGGALDVKALRGLVTLRRLFVGSRATFEAMNRAIETHSLHPVIDSIFPFDSAHEAYQYFDEKRHAGKVIISDTAA